MQMMSADSIAKQLRRALVGPGSYPMRLRTNDPPTDEEFRQLDSLVQQGVTVFRTMDCIPKDAVVAFMNVEPGLSQGIRFYSEAEADRIEDWRDQIVASLEELFEE